MNGFIEQFGRINVSELIQRSKRAFAVVECPVPKFLQCCFVTYGGINVLQRLALAGVRMNIVGCCYRQSQARGQRQYMGGFIQIMAVMEQF